MAAILRKVIEIGATVVIVLGLVAILFIGLNKSRDFSDVAFNKMDAMSVMAEEYDYTRYDGTTVSGGDVVSALKYFAGQVNNPICVTVNNGVTTKAYIYTDSSLSTPSTESIGNTSKKRMRDYYISPSTYYEGTVVRDAQGVIVEIDFVPSSTQAVNP